jgi:mannose-1-phosphate guanylyltransferase/mannose-6-phosphate isomerase
VPFRHVLILAGGRGERFWPWSRPERPKQLLPLARGGRTLLGATYERALRLVDRAHVLVMTSADLVAACQRECPGARVLGEPVGRNTAPAIATAAAWMQDADAFAVMPADAAIEDESAFAADLERAFGLAERESVLVTFGIRPSQPDTNFGYIRRGAALGGGVYRAAQFTEKPDRERAVAWVRGGEHLWNSGIFVWRRGVFCSALEAGRPALAAAVSGLEFPRTSEGFTNALGELYPRLESISVDYAVLEHAPNVVMIEAAFDWDDLGSWGAWARRQPRDARGNVLHGDAIALDCDRCVVVGDGGRAAAIGLSDMVVVHAQGATLACRLEDSERVREVARQRGAS